MQSTKGEGSVPLCDVPCEDPVVSRLRAQMEFLMQRFQEERWRLWSRSFAPRDRPGEDGRHDA